MTADDSDRRVLVQARLTGLLYLVIIVGGLFGEVFVRSTLIVRGDPATTAASIQGSTLLFRLGFLGDLAAFLADVAVAVLLYELLRPAGRLTALMSAGFRLVGTAVYGVNLLNHAAALHLLTTGARHAEETQRLALVFLDIHRLGYDLGLVFFGVHCLLVGWLLRRSRLFPGVLGWLMVAAGAGYLVGSGTLFLAPHLSSAVAPVYAAPLIGELALCAWLVVRGVRRGTGFSSSSRRGRRS